MELKLGTQSTICSVMYARLIELHGHIQSNKRDLTTRIPTVKDLEFFVIENRHYSEVRQAYIEFCNECGFDVDLHFEDQGQEDSDESEC